ncbi:MAG TPA: hypothetical protein VEI97_05885, partial [bacterium]|nr:hypothetical protein [bacterium]
PSTTSTPTSVSTPAEPVPPTVVTPGAPLAGTASAMRHRPPRRRQAILTAATIVLWLTVDPQDGPW